MTMINAYSVGIGLNAKGLVDGGILARKEISSLSRTMYGLVKPAERMTQQLNLIEKAQKSGTGDTQALAEAHARLTEKIRIENEVLEKNAAAQRKASLMQQAVANSGGPRQAVAGGGGFGGGRAGGGMGLLMLGQTIDDAQYGIRGIVNNIPGLVMALGGTMKMAGALGIAAVAVNQVAKAFENGTIKGDKFAKGNDYMAEGASRLGKVFDPLVKMTADISGGAFQAMGQGLGFLTAGLTDLITFNFQFENTNALIDKYKKEVDDIASDKKFQHAMSQVVPVYDAQAVALRNLTAEYNAHINTVQQMMKLSQPMTDEHNRFTGAINSAMDGARSGLIGTRVGSDGSTLIDMAREAAMNNLKLGTSKDHEGWAAAQEKYLNGTITSYKEYNGLLTQEQQLQLNSLDAMQKKAAKAQQDADAAKKRDQEAEQRRKQAAEEEKRERERIFDQAQKERENLDKMLALRSRIAEIEKMFGEGAISSEEARKLHSNAVEELAMQRVGLPPSNTAADLGTQEAYKVLTGQQSDKQEKQFVLMEQQKIEAELARKEIEGLRRDLKNAPVLKNARGTS